MKREVRETKLTWQVRTHFATLDTISRYSMRRMNSKKLCVSLFTGEGVLW